MALESALYLNSLVPANPEGGDSKSAGDDHIRLLKTVLQATFPGLAARFGAIQYKTTSYNIVATDNLSTVIFHSITSAVLSNAVAAGALGNGYQVTVVNYSSGLLTIDPSGGETVNGAQSVVVPSMFSATLVTDGSQWFALMSPVSGSTVPTGAIIPYIFPSPPQGFIFASGRTIGSPSSGATERGNNDTLPLYTLLWGSWDNNVLPIQDFNGSVTSRGGSAALDFSVNKRMPIPDLRGRVPVGYEWMSGVHSGRVSGAVAGSFDAGHLGNSGGEQAHVDTIAEMPHHAHAFADFGHSHSYSRSDPTAPHQAAAPHAGGIVHVPVETDVRTSNIQFVGEGGNAAHNTVQPGIAMPYIIKL